MAGSSAPLRVSASPTSPTFYIWDGQDQDERIVPPGSYLCRVEVEAQAGAASQHRIISVAY